MPPLVQACEPEIDCGAIDENSSLDQIRGYRECLERKKTRLDSIKNCTSDNINAQQNYLNDIPKKIDEYNTNFYSPKNSELLRLNSEISPKLNKLNYPSDINNDRLSSDLSVKEEKIVNEKIELRNKQNEEFYRNEVNLVKDSSGEYVYQCDSTKKPSSEINSNINTYENQDIYYGVGDSNNDLFGKHLSSIGEWGIGKDLNCSTSTVNSEIAVLEEEIAEAEVELAERKAEAENVTNANNKIEKFLEYDIEEVMRKNDIYIRAAIDPLCFIKQESPLKFNEEIYVHQALLGGKMLDLKIPKNLELPADQFSAITLGRIEISPAQHMYIWGMFNTFNEKLFTTISGSEKMKDSIFKDISVYPRTMKIFATSNEYSEIFLLNPDSSSISVISTNDKFEFIQKLPLIKPINEVLKMKAEAFSTIANSSSNSLEVVAKGKLNDQYSLFEISNPTDFRQNLQINQVSVDSGFDSTLLSSDFKISSDSDGYYISRVLGNAKRYNTQIFIPANTKAVLKIPYIEEAKYRFYTEEFSKVEAGSLELFEEDYLAFHGSLTSLDKQLKERKLAVDYCAYRPEKLSESDTVSMKNLGKILSMHQASDITQQQLSWFSGFNDPYFNYLEKEKLDDQEDPSSHTKVGSIVLQISNKGMEEQKFTILSNDNSFSHEMVVPRLSDLYIAVPEVEGIEYQLFKGDQKLHSVIGSIDQNFASDKQIPAQKRIFDFLRDYSYAVKDRLETSDKDTEINNLGRDYRSEQVISLTNFTAKPRVFVAEHFTPYGKVNVYVPPFKQVFFPLKSKDTAEFNIYENGQQIYVGSRKKDKFSSNEVIINE